MDKKINGLDMLENLKLLKADMEKHDWIIDSFLFFYKSIEYIVLAKRFLRKEAKKNPYALLEIEFIQSDNFSNHLVCEANSRQLFMDVKVVRKYFGIEYAANLGDVLKEFTKYFGQYVPDHVGREKTDLEKKEMVRSLSLSDSEDPNRIYCMCVKRNADGKKRSKYNSNKTRILRNALYEIFKDDETISFCFSSNPEDERSDKEILERLAKRNSI